MNSFESSDEHSECLVNGMHLIAKFVQHCQQRLVITLVAHLRRQLRVKKVSVDEIIEQTNTAITVRAGAGPKGKRPRMFSNGDSLTPAEYEAKINALVEAKDYAGAATLQREHRLCGRWTQD